jgi:hypothetical protein
MTYQAFIEQAQQAQRAYVREEQRRMVEARKLLATYTDAMRDLGLHPLNLTQLEARERELGAMARDVGATHGDSPVMRQAYEWQIAKAPA